MQILFLVLNICIMSQQPDPFLKIRSIPEKLEPLPFGSIKPGGWLLKQVQQNLDGFTGHLDSLAPDLLIKDDIYGKNRLSRKVKSKDLGALGVKGDWQVQFLWWNSETQGNWLDGYTRSAILANDARHLERVRKQVQYLLSTQDKDGYLGIYDQELRYKFNNENGELWAKTTLLRGLLAWYTYTKDKHVLYAVEKAVQDVMRHYPAYASHPFYSVKPDVGGLSHGLTFTDVLESLYRITKKSTYHDYALFCYKDFSEQALNEDGQYKKLLDTSLMLKGHGVHTYEQLRTVAAAYYISGNPRLRTALENFLKKIDLTTTASGGPVGDEWIGGKKANATSRGYEYCSLQELMHSYVELLIKSGEPDFGDRVEKLFFNTAQGARDPQQSCIAYLKSDNSYYMTGGLNGNDTIKHQTRYKYSPVHQDAAVCCVPNAGRIGPYFIQSMWMKEGNNLVAALLGPCEVNTDINGKTVLLKEKTAYPYDYTIAFEVKADAKFGLKIRKPSWAGQYTVSEPYREEDGFIIIEKNWSGVQTVSIEFRPEPIVRQDINGEHYFTYGSLVLAHPLKAVAARTKLFPLTGFADWEYTPGQLAIYQYSGKAITRQEGQLIFKTSLFNPDTHQLEPVELEPMGKTILRQVTFSPPVTGPARAEIIYHIFQRSFFDSDGDGHGDLKGIQQKLDYLQELGVTSILLTPLCQSDFYHNYFASDFEKIDPAYGSMATYISLVKEVHKRKMKIYQDIEMQYVDGNHPWFAGSYKNPGSAFSSYIYYLDGQNQQPYWLLNIPEFTTYNGLKRKIAVVNINNPEVREYTADLLGFWVDPNKDGLFDDGVDGFRLDHMMDDLDYAGKFTHLFKDFWTPVIHSLKQKNPSIRMIAEQANWNSLGMEYFNEGQIDDVFAFRLKFAIESFNKQKITAAADSTFLSMPSGKQQIVFIENHDTKRFASVDSQSLPRLKIGAALNLLLGGTPAIYYGQELGMAGKQLKGYTDGNDIPIREAFEWYKADTGRGMALWYKGTGIWWDSTNLKANDGISLEEERADPGSLWNYYREMIRLKKTSPAFAEGRYRSLQNDNDHVLSFLRYTEKESMMVVVNLSAGPQKVSVDPGDSNSGKLQTTLQPYEVRIVAR